MLATRPRLTHSFVLTRPTIVAPPKFIISPSILSLSSSCTARARASPLMSHASRRLAHDHAEAESSPSSHQNFSALPSTGDRRKAPPYIRFNTHIRSSLVFYLFFQHSFPPCSPPRPILPSSPSSHSTSPRTSCAVANSNAPTTAASHATTGRAPNLSAGNSDGIAVHRVPAPFLSWLNN